MDLLSSLKLNHLQLYLEHTVEYSQHQAVWQDSGAMSFTELRELRDYAADRGIELVPNQQSLVRTSPGLSPTTSIGLLVIVSFGRHLVVWFGFTIFVSPPYGHSTKATM